MSIRNKPLVSAIITTKNEADVISTLIRSIKEQSYENTEILVVDNNSTDETVAICKKLEVKVFNFGPERSAQRNYGAKKAKGNFLLFLDADMELSKGVIEQCIEKIRSDKEIAGIVIPEKSIARRFWERVKAYERSFYNIQGDLVTDAARFFKKEVFWKVGGYDEKITGPEDWDLPESIKYLGFKIGRISAKIYHHERIPSFYSLIRKKYYYGLKSHRYLKKQNISLIGPKTIYFLRPVFYKNWRRLIFNPILTCALIVMLFCELLAGAVGFVVERLQDE